MVEIEEFLLTSKMMKGNGYERRNWEFLGWREREAR
jgi:hypothetical protein